MAQQITIDIVAETKKLTQGLNDANDQIGGLNKQVTGLAKAATAAASAFVLKEGISFLKDSITEAKDARLAMNNAVSAFGAGSEALKQITTDSDKFSKTLGVDNDELIKLSSQLGAYLPASAKSLSTQLINLGYDVSAITGVDIDTWTKKFAKGMSDGTLAVKDLQKMVPGLTDAVYKQAEAMFKAGNAQGALNLLIVEGQKKYGDAAEKNVTAAQKLDVALANLKETIGTKVLPIIEKLTNILVDLIDLWDKQPDLLKNIELGLLAIVGVGGPLLSFISNTKIAMVNLGLLTAAEEGATLATGALSLAMKAIPIMAVIALIMLLITHWDDVKNATTAVWEKIKETWDAIYNKIKDASQAAIDWLKANWPLLLAVLTGPFGLFVLFITKHFDDLQTIFKDGWNKITEIIGTVIEILKTTIGLKFLQIFTDVVNWVIQIKDGVVTKFTELKDAAIDQFNKLKAAASTIWDAIKGFITGVAQNIKDKLGEVFGFMIEVGKDIARGIWQGLSSMTGWFKLLLTGWVNANIPMAVRKILGIASPSKVMAQIGEYAIQGLYQGMGINGPVGIKLPQINVGAGGAAGVNITINAGVGTDPYALGRTVQQALTKYGKISI